MSDLTKWKPWYIRILGAIMEMVGMTVVCVFFIPALTFLFLLGGGLALMGIGVDMMRKEK